ncbi:hypothetical protein PMIN04_000109 [Paraphaeosphaeria minitans]
MKSTTLTTSLAFAATTFATTIPAPAALRDIPDVTYTVPTTELSTLSTQLTGVSGTLQLIFINGNTIKSWYSVTDTKGNTHPVYMVTVVYDDEHDVLRCGNKLGHDRTQICGRKEYHRTRRISYIAPKWCVNLQGGPEKCVTGPKFENPRH